MQSVVQRELRQRAAFQSLEQEVLLAIQLAAHRVAEPLARHLKAQEDLTPSQYNVLRILRGARPADLTCREIGERMIARDPDITRLLDRLARQGLIARERDAEDRRAIRVTITPAGLETLAKLDPIVNAMPKTVLGNLGRKQLENLLTLLGDVIDQAARLH
jgi:DNA-binding MarR family transcriptional regulator